ncbi:MAG: toxin-antitoxin system YwqK family antitoxin [Deltaproteobacteria bacterium]|jgi:antitoxin component YwqK of YwqJK toxin-antitoxin module|nr:toxin-antitoxin system YwqK family antitoxin [Deltaproteobacteria bacterium]
MCRIALWIAFCSLVALPLPGFALAGEIECPGDAVVHGQPPPDGLKAWCELPDGTQHGPSLSWYEGGAPKAEAHFDEGKLDGVFKLWHPNGQLAEEGYYVDDQRHGTFSAWGEDGIKLLKQDFVKGQRNGEMMRWYPDGQLQFFEHYVDGEKDGPAVAYFENGQMEAEGAFRKGKFHGVWKGWYPDGSKRKVAEFVDGDRISVETFPAE